MLTLPLRVTDHLRRVIRLSVIASLASSAPSVWADCWERAGTTYSIDPLLLVAIAKVESNMRSDAINVNRNGTQDIGLMQVNSMHLPAFREKGISKQKLLEPCPSVMAGAEILSGFIKRHGYGWEAVGAYNAGSAPERAGLRRSYIRKIWGQYARLIAERRSRLPYRQAVATSRTYRGGAAGDLGR